MDYSAADPWPAHPKPCWRETLDHARARGWSLKTFTDHSFGAISCTTGACRVTVFTSGLGQETVARETRKRIDRCAHGSSSMDVLARVEQRLGEASRFIDAAESLSAIAQAEARIEVLSFAEETLGDAVFDEFAEQVETVEREQKVASAALEGADPRPQTATDALDAASDRVSEAREVLLTESPRARRVQALKAQAKALRARINALQS